jgi:membrane-bound serine protease (ClpP class)
VSARSRFAFVVAALAIAIAAFAEQRILAADAPTKSAAHAPPWVELITIDGSINPATASYIDDSLASANAEGASALVIELDTPGGLLNSAEKIVKAILAAPLPVIVYVAPSGASLRGHLHHRGRERCRDGSGNDDRCGASSGAGR